MEENKIVVIDEQGNELEYTILFTFESEELNKSFVLYYNEDSEGEVFASSYDENGALAQLEDDEWVVVEDVFNSFMEQGQQHHHHEGCCGGEEGDCGCDHDDEDHECKCEHNH